MNRLREKRVWKLRSGEVEHVLPQLLSQGLDGNRFLNRGEENWQKLVYAVSDVYVRRNLDNELVIPVRPIEGVFNGKLSYGRRIIGDSKDFFFRHENVYGGVTKTDLNLFDTSLYQRLSFYGVLEKCVVIETEAQAVYFDVNQRKLARQAYYDHEGCIKKAARSLGFISPPALRRMWVQDFNFKVRKPGYNLPEFALSNEEVNRILSIFVEEGNNSLRTARRVGCSITTVVKYARLNGLEVGRNGVRKT
ncbi:hypothetical protein J4459_02935 [Candidatus Woesearchaeota archaeon]|nr:hypothetical protein [Candidatus Woesearchaeota archaeon]